MGIWHTQIVSDTLNKAIFKIEWDLEWGLQMEIKITYGVSIDIIDTADPQKQCV